MSEAVSTDEREEAKPATPEEATPRADDAPVSKLAQRDGAIALAGLSLFAAADAWYAATGLAFASLLTTVNGIVVGVALGSLAHEWGHFAGARLSGGIAPTRGIRSLFPIFDFDMVKSEHSAFRAMSVGGNLAHWAVPLLLLVLLPLDTMGRTALFCAAFGFAVAASVTEVPIIRKAYAGASPIESFAGFSGDKLRRDRRIGAAAGLALFLLL